MSTIQEYYNQAQLSLAAYGTFQIGAINPDELVRDSVGMSHIQALEFASTYTVVDQYNNASIGLSATVFADAAGNKYLAIRGTQDVADLLTDVISIALLGTDAFQLQYLDLKWNVQQWINDGTLKDSTQTPSFTVTGHSLGGFLATGIAGDFSGNASHAYLYNSPGVGGLLGVGNALTAIEEALGITTPIDPAIFSNLKADAGISPIAGLGTQVAPVMPITIEDQTAPDVTGAPGKSGSGLAK